MAAFSRAALKKEKTIDDNETCHMNFPPVVDPGRDQRELVERLARIEETLSEVLLLVEFCCGSPSRNLS